MVAALRECEYVVLYHRRFVPTTERGRVLTAYLEAHFARWVAYGFTTAIEADLDRVAAGGVAWKAVLRGFWGAFEEALHSAGGLDRATVHAAVERALETYLFGAPGAPRERACPSCTDGRLGLKLGRYGAFIGCSRFPACRYRRPLAADRAPPGTGGGEPGPIGTDPDTGQPLTLRRGRYGLYVQRGADVGEERAARASVPRGMDPHDVTADVARALLALPRTVGVHPVSGETILAGIGRYGAWLKHGPTYVSLPDDEDVLAIGLNRAVMLVDTKSA